jgi:hypothetical protein
MRRLVADQLAALARLTDGQLDAALRRGARRPASA